jgi:molecular chaperone GrpE (heat shock protein)
MALFRRTAEKSDDIETSLPDVAAPIATASPAMPAPAEQAAKDAELEELRSAVLDMQRVLYDIADQGSAQNKVFDVLHTELQEYKNDFIYEHLKPVLWPLLFLFDSLEQYAREVVGRVSHSGEAAVEAKEVLDHLKFFRGQLVEALRICEVTPMKQPSGVIDPKAHKGIGVERVERLEDENTVRRVVRTGWYLNGKVLRHAEVIVGKYNEPGAPPVVAPVSPTSPANLSRAAEALRSSDAAGASGGGRGE